MLNISKFSSKYHVRKITNSDVKQVVALCSENTQFYEYCPPFVTEQSILDDMKALPEGRGKTMADKYYLGFFAQNDLIAVVDMIDAFPNKETIFIGFFMVNKSVQHQGVGTQIVRELRQALKAEGYQYIRLGWVQGNRQSEGFWKKNGFVETGVSYQTGGYTVIVAQRQL